MKKNLNPRLKTKSNPFFYLALLLLLVLPACNDSQNESTSVEVRSDVSEEGITVGYGTQTLFSAQAISFVDQDTDEGEISGIISITKAKDESKLTHYLLYWGISPLEKLSTTPIVELEKTGNNLTYVIPDNTLLPSNPEATHILVRAKNGDQEQNFGKSSKINDNIFFEVLPRSISFTDTDPSSGSVAGNIYLSHALDESSFTHYVLYWGVNETTKQSNTPIVGLPKTGWDVGHTFWVNTPIPNSPQATHILVFTSKGDKESQTSMNVAIVDLGVQVNLAKALSFTDTDLQGGEVAGTVMITKADDESGISGYNLYWGTSDIVVGNPLATFVADGSNPIYTFPDNTPVPGTLRPNHLIVLTTNSQGLELPTRRQIYLVDLGLPTALAGGVSFIDTDPDGLEVGGRITVQKSPDETSDNITDYLLYWGARDSSLDSMDYNDFTNNDLIAVIPATGADVTFDIATDTSIPGWPYAAWFYVFTQSSEGTSDIGISNSFIDLGVPLNKAQSVTFTDSDPSADKLSGSIVITAATDESDITDYVLYWGNSTYGRLDPSNDIATFSVGGSLTHTFTSEARPPGADYFVVYTKNSEGEMSTNTRKQIIDLGKLPIQSPRFVTFTDEDPTSGEVSGTITITPALDEANITDYVLYWGTLYNQKGSLITTLPKTGSNLTYVIPEDTAVSSGITWVLVYSKNAVGEGNVPRTVKFIDN